MRKLVPKNDTMSSTVIGKICDFLNCQPGDIMENITKEDALKAGQIWNQAIAQNLELLTSITGMSKEALLDEFQKEVPTFIEKLKSGDPDILGLNALVDESEKIDK